MIEERQGHLAGIHPLKLRSLLCLLYKHRQRHGREKHLVFFSALTPRLQSSFVDPAREGGSLGVSRWFLLEG